MRRTSIVIKIIDKDDRSGKIITCGETPQVSLVNILTTHDVILLPTFIEQIDRTILLYHGWHTIGVIDADSCTIRRYISLCEMAPTHTHRIQMILSHICQHGSPWSLKDYVSLMLLWSGPHEKSKSFSCSPDRWVVKLSILLWNATSKKRDQDVSHRSTTHSSDLLTQSRDAWKGLWYAFFSRAICRLLLDLPDIIFTMSTYTWPSYKLFTIDISREITAVCCCAAWCRSSGSKQSLP